MIDAKGIYLVELGILGYKFKDGQFDLPQLKTIYKYAKMKHPNVDIKLFALPWIDESEMDEIAIGMIEGIDASMYFNYTYERGTVPEVIQWMKAGLDIDPYLNQQYDPSQLKLIRQALVEGLYVDMFSPMMRTSIIEQLINIQRTLATFKYHGDSRAFIKLLMDANINRQTLKTISDELEVSYHNIDSSVHDIREIIETPDVDIPKAIFLRYVMGSFAKDVNDVMITADLKYMRFGNLINFYGKQKTFIGLKDISKIMDIYKVMRAAWFYEHVKTK